MNILLRRLSFSLFLVISSVGSLHAQPTAPTPEQNAKLRDLRSVDRPMAADAETLDGFSVDPAGREESRTFYRTVFLASEGTEMGWTGDYNTGDKGDTAQAYKDAVRRRINYFRAMAGIPATITFNSTYNGKAQAAALIQSANPWSLLQPGESPHQPPSNWVYWTQDGYDGSDNSNLSQGSAGPDAIVGYIHDHGGNNQAVGHRRWLLFPQTEVMGTGDVPGIPNVSNRVAANSTWVFDGNGGNPRPAVRDTFVAWPPEGYVPHKLVFPRWSLSLDEPKTAFASATVTMTRAIGNGSPQSINVVKEPLKPDFGSIGESTLVWVYDGLDANVSQNHDKPDEDTTYHVTVGNVMIGGQPQTFEYDVIVFDPNVAGADAEATTVSGSGAPIVGAENNYNVTTENFATGIQWRSLQSSDVPDILEGAENGTSTVDIVSTDGYEVFVSNPKYSGSMAFNLRHSGVNQIEYVRLNGIFLAGSDTQFSMRHRLAAVMDTETAAVQLSLNGGDSWISAWEHMADAQQNSFSLETISLSDFEGQAFEIRLVFSLGSSGGWWSGSQVGWYFDEIQLTNVETATIGSASNTLEGTSFSFNPPSAGDYGLQARPVFFEDYPLDWGPVTMVTAEEGAGNDPLIGGSPVGGNPGWFFSDWFGFYNTALAPWLFHGEHGFIYRFPGSTNASMYVFDDAMGAWWWTSSESSIYPFIYAFDPPVDNGGTDIGSEWIYYFEGTKGPRIFGLADGSGLFFDP